MLAPQTIPSITVRTSRTISNGDGISRLFSAAVVNPQFRAQLLDQPAAALASGYFGETFKLTESEASLITSHQARTLPELARLVHKALR
jgi:hypothetical protein